MNRFTGQAKKAGKLTEISSSESKEETSQHVQRDEYQGSDTGNGSAEAEAGHAAPEQGEGVARDV